MRKTNVKVKLIDEDWNVFNLIGIVSRALKRAGEKELASAFMKEAFSSHSYEEVLSLIGEYVIIR